MKSKNKSQTIRWTLFAVRCSSSVRISLCRLALGACLSVLLIQAAGCGKKPASTENTNSNPPSSQNQAPVAAPDAGLQSTDANATPEHALTLPVCFHRWTGDYDGMVKRRVIRALVVNSKAVFFYDKGRARGIIIETLEEFAKFVNKKLGNPNPAIKVTYTPVATSQLASALNEGLGDIAATAIIVSPEREKLFDFTIPMLRGVKLILVTNAAAPDPKSLEDLSGQEVWANPLTIAYQKLKSVNDSLKKAGKPEINVVASDNNLTEEDLLEMTNSGLIPATVAMDVRANFWAQIYPSLRVHPDIVLQDEGNLAWAMRKNSPQLKQILDEFAQSHQAGTTFGNTMLKRYLKDTKWVKNSTTPEEIKKFNDYIQYFKEYGEEYDFDYLMLAAQGYQESMLNQDRKSPAGAVGVMQVIPKYAAAKPINIPDVNQAKENIHAGAKMMHNIAATYFNDPAITLTNKTLFTFAAYNAGPGRVRKLQRMATEQGLDPNVWFGNVELMAAKDIGQETVQYVSNIYKYYVAYKMTLEQNALREKAKQSVVKK